ncbi:PTS sugar transporter subunit IIA [Anaerostipes sp.]|uniref:PTS sugar transporter subunit IIA n=1 Tax=Anaerostipes sp. TaxID=1872530 RepID=UPI0025B94274|nr:PTS fructose transporter subunit IIA [Anaerostipes sp.]MBS7009536.1 PTS fructose transporter subunit IIA [Anaerostipes sp.]
MKKRLLIATHSTFAEGIKNAMELVTGRQDSVSTLCAYTDNMSEVETPVREIIEGLGPDEELIIATDIFGGSVNNEFMKYLTEKNIHLVAGVNLPLLFELVSSLNTADTKTAVETAINNSREQIRYCNLLLDQAHEACDTF